MENKEKGLESNSFSIYRMETLLRAKVYDMRITFSKVIEQLSGVAF